ncbi:MAG: dienelactone hydrolase family protein [Acidobacteria bacterium]|nr:dienelactone hydrolase family protein [Acidobacteriota bacterium]MCA1650715.1 dienelactone hydrolase family protein [Acidobacteriota bacterium]
MTGRSDLTVYPSAHAFSALVVAHGAGAGQTNPWLVRMAGGLAERGVTAATFDFGYMAAGRKFPDAPAVLETRWREIVDRARAALPPLPLFIGGKSMGGRIASQIAAKGVDGVTGLIFFGYPLHPPGKPQQRRDTHLPAITHPMLFIQGSADTFGKADEIRALIPSLQRAELHEVAGGDHSLKVKGGAARQATVAAEVIDTAVTWMRSVV